MLSSPPAFCSCPLPLTSPAPPGLHPLPADVPQFMKAILKLKDYERLVANLVQLFFMPTKKCGALDMEPEMEANYVY